MRTGKALNFIEAISLQVLLKKIERIIAYTCYRWPQSLCIKYQVHGLFIRLAINNQPGPGS